VWPGSSDDDARTNDEGPGSHRPALRPAPLKAPPLPRIHLEGVPTPPAVPLAGAPPMVAVLSPLSTKVTPLGMAPRDPSADQGYGCSQ
jgi:hypothetical protein